MPKVVNTNPNAPTLVNGVAFELVNGKMVSVDDVEGENLEIFSAIPGWVVLNDSRDKDAAPAPVAPAQAEVAPAAEAAPVAVEPAEEATAVPAEQVQAEGQDAAPKVVTKKK